MFRARAEVLKARAALLRPSAVGGRWGERFLTLTLPHSGDVGADIKCLPQLWRKFRRKLVKYLQVELSASKEVAAFPYVRVLEVTPGADRQGHAHLHVWMLSPFLPHEVLRMWWGQALKSADYRVPTRPLEEVLNEAGTEARRRQLSLLLVRRHGRARLAVDPVPWPVLDVRVCYGAVEREFIKYLVKDAERSVDGELEFMDPELFAEIYMGFEGLRSIQGSCGLWPRQEREESLRACTECGCLELATRRMKVAEQAQQEGQPGGQGGEHG